MREYEIVYILDSNLDQDAVDAKLEAFHAALGGEITSVDHWGVRQLAYPIQKSQTGYYVIVHVATHPEALPEFERLLKLDEEAMRYLIVLNEGQPASGASVLAELPVIALRKRAKRKPAGLVRRRDESGETKRRGRAACAQAEEAGGARSRERRGILGAAGVSGGPGR